VADGEKKAAIEQRKTEMLATVYRILSLCLGEPPTEFTWTRKNAAGEPVETKTYTPQSFYKEYVGADLKNDYVMLMNDPSRPYHKTYTIDLDRHSYDGAQWTYINLPMEEIKEMAIASIKDSTMMYYSCDVGKCYNSKTGVLSLNNYDFESLFATDFPMNKADRIRTFASASSHAMTLMAVDLDENGKPRKWMVENSWGPASGYKGHLIMTDSWFDEYTFRLVVDKKYVPEATLKLLKQKPTLLPAWDPLFAPEQ
jgi:bleomycin hydrolase